MTSNNMDYITIALPKGKLFGLSADLLAKVGYTAEDLSEKSRKLVITNEEKKIKFIISKTADVPTYVEYGAADIGIIGKDVLLESGMDVYELLDLGIGKCRMAVAGPKGFRDSPANTLRVATKFPNIAQDYYNEKCRDIDIIKLNGSIELAPIMGLSDVIVDIVETGTTLKENSLVPFETIVPISARLISNKASHKFKQAEITAIVSGLKGQVNYE